MAVLKPKHWALVVLGNYVKNQGSWDTPLIFSGDSNAHLSWGTSDREDMISIIWKILKDVDI